MGRRVFLKMILRGLVGIMLLGAMVSGAPARAADDAAWAALRSGEAFAIMRHALAPGYSDPAHFDETDCATQRNLSDEGRAQAREIGDVFRASGIAEADVLTSVWCRCRETAELLGLGPVADLRPLNSFFEHRERREPQTEALRDWLAARAPGKPLVLVTHQVNISALLGRATRSGETLIAAPDGAGGFRILGGF